MEWVLRSPQIHSTFSNLGFLHTDGYHLNENCNAALENILHNILTEDKYLRTYRRSISFGQNVKKDLIPLLMHAKDDRTIELLIRILVNLTIPIECLLSVDVISKNDFGRHTIFEINNLLSATKVAFTDQRVTKVVVDFLKKNVDVEQNSKLSPENSTNISNSLLLLRNILHIPVDIGLQSQSYGGQSHTVQNQILWNLFSQSIDKIIIKLMINSDAKKWAVTMVQLIALLYKDQHVVTLQKFLNLWLEASSSESSEDNESNTSPPDRAGSEDSSPILTSDPTSDSSDNGGSGQWRNNRVASRQNPPGPQSEGAPRSERYSFAAGSGNSDDEPNSENNGWELSPNNASERGSQRQYPISIDNDCEEKVVESDTGNSSTVNYEENKDTSCNSTIHMEGSDKSNKSGKKVMISETSDCGYGTQIENQGSISTSSNDDEMPSKKPVHQKPHNPKQRINTKNRSGTTMQERKRKKIVKRGKSNIINVQGLSHKTPTDDDISNILKEFTVDFLLKGYNALVRTLHNQILTNLELEIDTSHFFWLVTYFLKFATQIELDLLHVSSVLSFDIVSYLTAEGVNLCEQFELAIKLDGNDLKPCMRRLHLVVTAIREFVQAIEVYKKISHLCKDDQEALVKLQIKMCETEELRSLIVLLLRHYNPKYHNKQYLQDIVVTNHILLMFLDNVMKLPDYTGSTNMTDHIRQFATNEIMYQYGVLLEDYATNGEFVNDCLLTLMHHVGGELDSLITLFQPNILKTFTSIWKSEFQICDDWSDLIEYVINTFIKKPQTLQSMDNIRLDNECFDEENAVPASIIEPSPLALEDKREEDKRVESHGKRDEVDLNYFTEERWTEDELMSLSWYYMQSNSSADPVRDVIKLFKDDDVIKSRDSVVRQLYTQNIIGKELYEKLMESRDGLRELQDTKEDRDAEIAKLCELLRLDGKAEFLYWVQRMLLDTCFAKIYMERKALTQNSEEEPECKLLNFELFRKKTDFPVLSPVCYHSLLCSGSVPLVPWNCSQAAMCKDLRFLQLVHRLGFLMPVDSGKVFIRIPHFWSAEVLFEVAGKIAPVDITSLKFSLNDIPGSNDGDNSKQQDSVEMTDVTTKYNAAGETNDMFYQIHKQNHLATMVNFTPTPGTSFVSDKVENEKHDNWLEVVQKSHEYKLQLSLGRGLAEVPAGVQPGGRLDPPVHTAPPPVEKDPVTSLATTLVITTTENVLTTIAEPEFFNNSMCETASVASDLTRMYVSDEEEKLDDVMEPALEVTTPSHSLSSAESEYNKASKRQRVQYTSTLQ